MEYHSTLSSFALLAAALGLLGLSVPLLLSQVARRKYTAPLILFLVASGIANALPLMIEIYPALNLYGLAIFLPCYTLLPASLWCYICAISSPIPWQPKVNQCWHLAPFLIAVLISLCLWNLPKSELQSIFGDKDQELPLWPEVVVISAFVLMVIWVLMSAVYVIAIVLRLRGFRTQLKNLFANNESRELHWVNIAMIVLSITWGLSLLYSLPLLSNQQPPLPVALIAAAHFALLWTLSIFGIKQIPSYEGRYLSSQAELAQTGSSPHEKYQKSALNEEALQRIANKLDTVMRKQNLFLDNTLSLQKLARETQTSTNYLSQTLNHKLNTSFFDYINTWRIQYAVPEVLKGEKSILDVAMDAGFNARSSFYKAFKKETGCSPSEYKKRKVSNTEEEGNI